MTYSDKDGGTGKKARWAGGRPRNDQQMTSQWRFVTGVTAATLGLGGLDAGGLGGKAAARSRLVGDPRSGTMRPRQAGEGSRGLFLVSPGPQNQLRN